jgi:phosphoribosyl-ATP pyrophosphohydrolase
VTHVYDPEAGVPVPVSQKAGILQKAKQFVSPEAATQPEAQTAFRGGAQASASDAGVASQVPAANASSSVRTLMTKPIAEAARVENNLYSTINDAAEIDMKSLYDRQEELQDTLDDPTQIANKSALQQELKTTQTNIAGGEAKVTAKLGENASDLITKAKAATQQRYAMEVGDQKLFNNESVVSGNTAHGADETIKVDAAIRQAENLDKPSKFAPRGTPTRLEQMFGEDGAKAFKQGLYDAHKSGQTVLTRNRIIEIFGGTTGGLGLLYKLFR